MSNYSKLKTNLKLAIQRLKLLEKKKTELSLKSRKEIADFLAISKPDRARIRVEHIIREDNYVEAMEMLEMFCDLLLARFGLIEKMKELDPGLDEAIATLIWASPRVSTDIAEFKIIAEALSHKYGKQYAEACKADKINNVNEKVKKRLGLNAPPKLLVEQYLIEIAKNFNINYVPDNNVMLSSGQMSEELIQLRDHVDDINKRYGGAGGGGGGAAAPPNAATPLYPAENKQVPLGFNDLDNPYRRDLIDLDASGGGDINNNSTKLEPPSLPKTLPSGELNNPPPPFYYPNLVPNDGLTKNTQLQNDFDLMNANAPPLPSKQHGSPSVNEFGHSPPPMYNMDYFEKPIPPKMQPNQQNKLPITDDEDDLGLPAVPNSQPDSFEPSNNNVGNASIDYDELTKRFQNLKSFK